MREMNNILIKQETLYHGSKIFLIKNKKGIDSVVHASFMGFCVFFFFFIASVLLYHSPFLP